MQSARANPKSTKATPDTHLAKRKALSCDQYFAGRFSLVGATVALAQRAIVHPKLPLQSKLTQGAGRTWGERRT